MRNTLLIALLPFSFDSIAQRANVDTVGMKVDFENVYNSRLFSDSMASSFTILIKKEVKEHKHATHSEHVIVVDGEALMTLADSSFTIKKNDVVFIPMNTYHSVKTTSKIPLKVISIQSPYFDGKDRIFK